MSSTGNQKKNPKKGKGDIKKKSYKPKQTNVPVKKVSTEVKSKRKEKTQHFGLVTTKLPQYQTGTNTMLVQIQLESRVLDTALATFASHLYFTNILGANVDSVNQRAMAGGANYLGQAIQAISRGETFEAKAMPRIFDFILSLLCAKRIAVGEGFVSYSPDWTQSAFDMSQTISTGVGTFFTFVVPAASQPFTNTPAVSIVTQPDDYSNFLKVSEATKSWGASVINTLERQAFSYYDPSAYARCYKYVGYSGTSSGFYNEVELECNFEYPMFSRFVTYNVDDSVVSRIFYPQAGGISTPIGLSLLCPNWNYTRFRSKRLVTHKYIDFYQIYSVVCSWLVAVWNSNPPGVQGDDESNSSQTIVMGVRDFQWLLRQAVLTMFPEQCFGQFVAPVAPSGVGSESLFQPFVMDAITTPLPMFAKMLLPSFIVENLNQLRMRVAYPPAGSRDKDIRVITPVLGVYSQDTPPEFQFRDKNGFMQDLFQLGNLIPQCSLADASTTNTGAIKANVNSYVSAKLDYWNTLISTYATARSVPLSPLSTDAQLQTSLLSFTRVLEFKPDPSPEEESLIPKSRNPFLDYVINDGVRTVMDGKKKMVIQPATYSQLYTETITSCWPLSTEVSGAIEAFILPSIRLNPSSGDYLTRTAYQTITGELCQNSNVTGLHSVEVASETSRILAQGAMFNAGFAPGDSSNNALVKAQTIVSDKSEGLNFLNSLFSGLASVVPVVGPILSNLIAGE